MLDRVAKPLSLALLALVCCGASDSSCNSSNQSVNIPPSAGQAAGILIVAGAVVATAIIVPIEIHKHHHALNGCVYSTPNGLELRTSDEKVYTLSGETASVKPGMIVRLHGDRQKHDKNSPGDQVFLVKEIKKTSGPCPVANASISLAPSAPSAGTTAQAHP